MIPCPPSHTISQISRIRPILLCLFSLFTFHPSLFGASAPLIRAHIETPPPIYTGQHITLVVELLAPGYFDSAASFDLPDRQGLLLMPPQDSPTISTETAGGTTYTVQRHELALFAARPGPQTIPPFTARFAYKLAPLDKADLHAELKTPPLPLTITAPPGTEHLGLVISAHNLSATETWTPRPAAHATRFKTGDALTRTITYAAPDIPGMLFPPFPHAPIEGLAIYPKTPEILDITDRGALTGKRRDTITYICEQPGSFTIPAARLTWFDLDSRTLRTIDFPGRTFDVAGAPAAQPGKTAPAHPARAPLARLAIGFGAIALLALAFAFRHPLARLLAPFRPVHLQPLNPPPAKKSPRAA